MRMNLSVKNNGYSTYQASRCVRVSPRASGSVRSKFSKNRAFAWAFVTLFLYERK